MSTSSPAVTAAYPMPATWVMSQKWRHLLFASWPLPPDELRRHVPPNFDLDTFDGKAWLSILPMHMEDLHFRWLPPIPGTSDFPEINMRTYVRVGAQRGIYFFSIDAACLIGSWVARTFFHTPYTYAHMALRESGSDFHMECRRRQSSRRQAAELVVSYRALGTPVVPPAGTLADFLTARDTAFAESRGAIYTGPISHAPWKLTDAEAEFSVNTLAASAGITLPKTRPEVHFSWGTDTKLAFVTRLHT